MALGLALALTSCGPPAPPPPVVSPTGIVYEPGTPPRETRASQTASLYIRQERYERAVELLLEGIEFDAENPIHYYLAGAAYSRLRRYTAADSMFDRAVDIYPAYELDVEPEREAAWAAAFNRGLELYAEGGVEEAIDAWWEATLMSDLRPEAHRNLASVLALEGRYDEAVETYRKALVGLEGRPATRVLDQAEIAEREEAARDIEGELARLYLLSDRFAEAEPLLRAQLERDPGNVDLRGDLAAALNGLGREDEAAEIYTALLRDEGLQTTQLFNFGVALFRTEDYERASEAFERLTQLQPESRDAWFNYANSLFAAEAWAQLARVGTRLLELDPLSENAHLITARALLETGDREGATRTLDRADSVPVYLEGLQLRRSGDETRVVGSLTGKAAAAGAEVRLRFTFYDNGAAPVGSRTVSLAAPPQGETREFEVAIQERATSYRYELLD